MRPPGTNIILTFGRYRGFKLVFIPSSYLFWLSARATSESFRTTLLDVGLYNKMREICYTEEYDSMEEFIMDASDGFADNVKIVRIKGTTVKRKKT